MEIETYWINTLGRGRIFMTLHGTEEPTFQMAAMYGVKKCNRLTFWLFKKTKINLLAKDKFAWLRKK